MPSAASVPKPNAFGVGSPSWNLSFPAGNLTAAKILAYLNVEGFRSPRVTHPRRGKKSGGHNREANPIPFKDLALHVKENPEDNDALDLTHCVLYALAHEEETWLFPTDFARLVIHLGGPREVTHSHFDKNAFARREAAITLAARAPKSAARISPGKHKADKTTMARTRIERALLMARSTTPKTLTTHKRENDLGKVLAGSKRRSGRLVGKEFNLREDDSDATDKDFFDSPYSGTSTPTKKRKISRLALPTETANDSDFVQDDSEPDDDIPEADDTLEEDEVSPSKARATRAAASKARASIKNTFISARPPLVVSAADVQFGFSLFKPEFMTRIYDPEITQAALKYPTRDPVFFKPPILSKDRLRVDESSVYLFAAEGCTTQQQMWESALSSTRFNGPRRSAPYRELYRLTDPSPLDASDWAENIRWAKEQKRLFGSDTWTEYDYHLEQITEARKESLWVSEEAIRAGM